MAGRRWVGATAAGQTVMFRSGWESECDAALPTVMMLPAGRPLASAPAGTSSNRASNRDDGARIRSPSLRLMPIWLFAIIVR